MITLEEAQERLLSLVSFAETECLPLEQCFNRILAQDLYAGYDFPPFDRSPLDGYAVRYADVKQATAAAPAILTVIDHIPAGTVSAKLITPGTAMRIMTGAPIPVGADAIVRLEDTEDRGNQVAIRTGAGSAKNICAKGEEIGCGERILTAGSRIDENSVGLLAMFGINQPIVYRKPRIGILSTGSEIVGLCDPLLPGKIRDTNSQMLMMEVLAAGGVPVMLGRVADDLSEIKRLLLNAPVCDLIVTTGGASVGDHDLIAAVYAAIGAELLFSRVAMKPGMPVLAGLREGQLFIGLSGNPAAASVSYKLLVRPLIRKMAGDQQIHYVRTKAALSKMFLKTSPTRRFVWGQYRYETAGLTVLPLLFQGNGMLRSRPGANCLIEVPPDNPPLEPGTTIDILILD